MGRPGPNRKHIALLTAGLAAALTLPMLLSPVQGIRARQRALARVDALAQGPTACLGDMPLPSDRPEPLASTLASWRTVGGCGAGASTGNAAGVKWIGRSVTGGLLGVQCQLTYTRLPRQTADTGGPEHHAFLNALITAPVDDRWILGANVPLVMKYMINPLQNGADLSNTGLGDMSVQLTRKLGPIGATALTIAAGLPTGQYNGEYRMRMLNQTQQRGFGKPSAALTLDHTADEIWGLTLVGATASWRGGENDVNDYRAPTASTYGYVGWYLGPLVPALGLSATAAAGHDRDKTTPMVSGLYTAAANVSLEWSTDWIAILAGASFPYQYDGYRQVNGVAHNPWGWAPWVVGVGFSVSPF
jgi:hypothetical protein